MNRPESDNYGDYTQLIALPVGARFYVTNGAWDGEIVDNNGVKSVEVEGDRIYALTESDYLVISIQKDTDIESDEIPL